MVAGSILSAPYRQATPRAASARFSAPSAAGSSGGMHDRAAAREPPQRHFGASRDPAIGLEHLAGGRDVPARRLPVHPRHRRHSHDGHPAVVDPELVRIQLGVGLPPAGGQPGDRQGRHAPPTCTRAWRGGRLPTRAVTGVPAPESPTSETVRRPPSALQGCGPVSSRAMPTLARRGLVGAAHDERHLQVGRGNRARLEVGEQRDLARPRLARQHLAGEAERRSEIDAPRAHRERGHAVEQRLRRSPRRGTPSAASSQSASSGVARLSTCRRPRLQLRQSAGTRRRPPRCWASCPPPAPARWARGSGDAAARQRRAGGRQDQRDDEQRAQQQQQQVLQLEPALMLPGGGDEVADRGEHDGRRLAAGQQMEQERNRRGDESGQRPGVKEADHAVLDEGASASRSTTP